MTADQKVLANRLKVCGFALVETSLYLDTHPTDRAALAFYKKYDEMYHQAHKEYVAKYGPIVHGDYNGGDTWNWVDGPWPWEGEN